MRIKKIYTYIFFFIDSWEIFDVEIFVRKKCLVVSRMVCITATERPPAVEGCQL